jgi:hypothetical protein
VTKLAIAVHWVAANNQGFVIAQIIIIGAEIATNPVQTFVMNVILEQVSY